METVFVKLSLQFYAFKSNFDFFSNPNQAMYVRFYKHTMTYILQIKPCTSGFGLVSKGCDELVVRPVSTPTKLALFIALFSARLDLNAEKGSDSYLSPLSLTSLDIVSNDSNFTQYVTGGQVLVSSLIVAESFL
ncbi:hypothetical protein F2Q69_00004032 [Brassica cretica]|uniref:Uncharacterized protein n=1 Tax=Brassica cretica TaxID=69181 RepID=A0A8S9P150_BRACR|nr:hypothetical protein F2Q69_00004032 [Brassica cretica]